MPSKKKPASSKRASLPRAADYTKAFSKDWERLERSGRYDMKRLKEAMLLLVANDAPLDLNGSIIRSSANGTAIASATSAATFYSSIVWLMFRRRGSGFCSSRNARRTLQRISHAASTRSGGGGIPCPFAVSRLPAAPLRAGARSPPGMTSINRLCR